MSKVLIKHIKCRNNIYPRSNIQRFSVPDDLLSWKTDYPNYQPEFYESSVINGKPWSDLRIDDKNFHPKWNTRDGQVCRTSFCGDYEIRNGYPMNPMGRTGLTGRGVLGRWGPNHAADPIVTRWKRDVHGNLQFNEKTKQKILQMCAIQRHDCGEWAIPGGMVDPGEQISATLKREFMEEALSTSDSSLNIISDFFSTNGQEIYKGYVDDPRNTDNAWMETVAVNFHDADNTSVGKFKLEAGDDAANVKWMDINSSVKLYASHLEIIQNVIKKLDADW